MRLTFEPLRRNRYRVHGLSMKLVVKKAQIDRTRRVYSDIPKRVKIIPKPLPTVNINLRYDYWLECPNPCCMWYCEAGRFGEMKCPVCSTKFLVVKK